MSKRDADGEDVPSRVHRSVRRTVGLKVMRDLSHWAGDVERQRAQRPRLVLWLLVLILAIVTVASLALGVL